MPKFNVGEFHKFLSPKEATYRIKEIIEKDTEIDLDFPRGFCPKCEERIIETKHYNLKIIYVLEDKDGEIGYMGETAEENLIRMPDVLWNADKIDSFNKKIKELKNGN